MAESNWLQILASIIGGGAAGAFISNAFTHIRNRKLKVGYKIEIVPVFKSFGDSNRLDAQILVATDESKKELKTYNNLFLAEITIINQGQKDYDCFEFGLTLGEKDECIYTEPKSSDRHHIVEEITKVNPKIPSKLLDFKLKPFNRKEKYEIKLYIVIEDGCIIPSKINISSSMPVIFKETEFPSMKEILIESLIETIKLSPMSFKIKVG